MPSQGISTRDNIGASCSQTPWLAAQNSHATVDEKIMEVKQKWREKNREKLHCTVADKVVCMLQLSLFILGFWNHDKIVDVKKFLTFNQ